MTARGARKVVRLHPAEHRPVPEVVTLLKEALTRAKSGEIIGIGIVAACAGRADLTCYDLGAGDVATLVLACRRLERRLLDHGES